MLSHFTVNLPLRRRMAIWGTVALFHISLGNVFPGAHVQEKVILALYTLTAHL